MSNSNLSLPSQFNGPTEFVHLHCHTVFSPLDGVATPEQYAEECEKRSYVGMSATEHGNMASVPDMHFAFKKRGLKFISGCELYYNDYEPIRQKFVAEQGKMMQLKEDDLNLHRRIMRNRHLTVLAKNEIGFHNLIKLSTLAYKFGFFYKPRVWFDKLCEYKEGLIILSGCWNGPVSHELYLDFQSFEETGKRHERVKGRDKTAIQYAKMFQKEFGDDFVLEVQMPLLPDLHDHKIFWTILQLADKLNIKAVLTNDSHYLTRDDFYLQCVMMAVDQKVTVDDPNLFASNSDEQFFKTRADLWATFVNNKYSARVSEQRFAEICDTTLEIAERCDVFTPDVSPKIPDWASVEPGMDAGKELRRIARDELVKRKLHKVKKRYPVDGREVTYIEQTAIELERFISKGFASYFLITQDLIQYGRRRGWPFGPRGCTTSGALINISGSELKAIEDIQIGDSIIDGFGNDRTVENKFVYDIAEELYIFELDDRIIEVTGDHKLYIIRGEIVMLLRASEIIDADEIIGNLSDQGDIRADESRMQTDLEYAGRYTMKQLLPSQIQNISELQKLVSASSVERLRIKRMSRRQHVGKVYDLQVSVTNTYRLNGVFSSNSAGGSLVCFLLGIHCIDPLKWGLSFDRFMASSRGGYMLKVSME